MAGQKPPDRTLYPYNTKIWQPSWCCSTLSIMSLNWYKCYILSCYSVCYHWLLSIHMCTCIFVFPSISRYFPLRGIGQGLSLDRAVFPGNYRPGISHIYKPTDVHTRTSTCTWCVSTWCTWVLIGENAKYLYLYLITSTWSIWVLDQLYPNPAFG